MSVSHWNDFLEFIGPLSFFLGRITASDGDFGFSGVVKDCLTCLTAVYLVHSCCL